MQTLTSTVVALRIHPVLAVAQTENPSPDATDLKELDLSFNCFGEKGGEAIGASLHVNTSLQVRFPTVIIGLRVVGQTSPRSHELDALPPFVRTEQGMQPATP